MYDYLQGTVIDQRGLQTILDVNGVGYCLNVSAKTMGFAAQFIGGSMLLYTELITTEYTATLYGFKDTKERDLFNLVKSVSRIGAKIALSVCSHLTREEFDELITNKDEKALSKIPGLGKKTAQRMIVELADKVTNVEASTESQVVSDAVSAVVNLGYAKKDVQAAVKAVMGNGTGMTLDVLIVKTLGNLTGG